MVVILKGWLLSIVYSVAMMVILLFLLYTPSFFDKEIELAPTPFVSMPTATPTPCVFDRETCAFYLRRDAEEEYEDYLDSLYETPNNDAEYENNYVQP